jgi:hypothetical protein
VTFSQKKRRKITVGDHDFFWVATGNDGYIDLCVSSEIKGSPKLLTAFDYHYDAQSSAKQFVVTPFIVRQVIEHALQNGWKPFEKGRDLELPAADKFNLNLLTKTKRPPSVNPKSKI